MDVVVVFVLFVNVKEFKKKNLMNFLSWLL